MVMMVFVLRCVSLPNPITLNIYPENHHARPHRQAAYSAAGRLVPTSIQMYDSPSALCALF